MLVDGNTINEFLKKYNITVKGVLHIGAHECEEKGFYNNFLKVNDDRIIWVDGNKRKVEQMKSNEFLNIYFSVLDETERYIEFNITDNSQASSILTLNHENGFYNNINIIEKTPCKTETLSNFFRRIDRHPDNYNFWNLDIQGSELFVMRGSKELLSNCDVIYTEVNQEHVYKGCGLVSEIDDLLGKYGFVRVHTIWTEMKWGDALYLKIR